MEARVAEAGAGGQLPRTGIGACAALETVLAPPPSTFPYRLARLGVLMRRRAGVRTEAEGVLNPASATAPDRTLFPEPVPGPDGRPSYALLHRPVWDDRPAFHRGRAYIPSWLGDARPSIWISYTAVEEAQADLSRLAAFGRHRVVASPGSEFESAKIGAGTPPVRTLDGWLTIHHGVRIVSGRPRYCAGRCCST